MHVYEVRPRKDHRGVDLIFDVLPFGRLWYAGWGAQVFLDGIRNVNRTETVMPLVLYLM
jgi:hypothetical protein